MLAPTLSEKTRDREIDEANAKYSDLFSELLSAFLECDPGRLVSSPGYGLGMTPAFDLLIEEMAGRNSDDMRSRLAYIVGAAARQKGDEALQVMALRFLRDVAHNHAEASL